MIIQINTDKNVTVRDDYEAKLNEMLTHDLKRFSSQITRLELYLSDENGLKKGVDEKRCALEARIAGRKPVGVTANGKNYDMAVKNAIDKIRTVLDTAVSK